MTTEREEFEKWYHQYIDNGYSTNSFEVNMFEAWQARGRLDTERIAEYEAEDLRLRVEIGELSAKWWTKDQQVKALSLQNQVLREALEMYTQFSDRRISETATIALSTTPNQDEWIRKSDLEIVGINPDHVVEFSQLFKIRGE